MNQPTPEVPCYRHPQKAASDICGACLKNICDLCAVADGANFLCPACVKRVRSRRRILWIALAALGLLVVAGAVGWFLVWYEEPFEYGNYQARVHRLSKRLEKDPCDRVKMLRFANLLFDAGDFRRCVERSRRFVSECGPYPRLLWTTYEVHKRMGLYDQAIADVKTLIAEFPYDKDFRWWLGEVYERKREWGAALAAYRQALGLQPRLSKVPFDLMRVAKLAKRPCEGIQALEQFVFHHMEYQDDRNLLHNLEQLYRSDSCRGMAGQGQATVAADPTGQNPVEVVVNTTQPGKFVLDTGCGYTLLSAEFAESLGLESGTKFLASDGLEAREGRLVVLQKVELGEARAERIEAVVVDKLLEGVDGVLGLSFLTRFALSSGPDGSVLLDSKL